MIRPVSRETGMQDEAIYTRLIAWAAWATDRSGYPSRVDELAGGFVITDAVAAQLRAVRRRGFCAEIDAIEKAVAAMRTGNGGDEMFACFERYFLQWKTIGEVAQEVGDSEFHVIAYLKRAIRLVAHALPACERRVAAKR